MNRADKEHFIGLEWLRFLLGLYVVVFHTLHTYPDEQKLPWIQDLVGIGFFATSSFFVLSGFLLAHVYCKHGQLREPAISFWSRRFANLYPLHVFSLLLTIATIFVISHLGIPPDDTNASLRFVIYDTNEDLGSASREALVHWMGDGELVLNGVLQVLLLQAWNPYYLTFNPPLWSISTLCFFYLSFPLLAPRLMRTRHKAGWLAALGLLYLLPPIWAIHSQEYGMPYTGLLHRMPLLRLPEFLAGILLYGLFRELRDAGHEPSLGSKVMLGSFTLTCFGAAAWLLQGEQLWYFLLHNGMLLPAQLTLIYLCALIGSPSGDWLRHWAQRLGAAALPLFVLHVPAFTLFSRAEKLLSVASPSCFENWRSCALQAGEQPLSLGLYPLFLLLTIALCVWAQENTVIPVRKWLLKRMPVSTTQ